MAIWRDGVVTISTSRGSLLHANQPDQGYLFYLGPRLSIIFGFYLGLVQLSITSRVLCVQAWLKTSPDATNRSTIQDLLTNVLNLSVCQLAAEKCSNRIICWAIRHCPNKHTNTHSLTHNTGTTIENALILHSFLYYELCYAEFDYYFKISMYLKSEEAPSIWTAWFIWKNYTLVWDLGTQVLLQST